MAQSATFDGASNTQTHYTARMTKRELLTEQRGIFDAVVSAYVRARSRPVMAAANPDRDAGSDEINYRWTATIADFMCDVELATEAALGDDLALQAAWFGLALDEVVPRDIAAQVVGKCARIYKARKFHHHYGNLTKKPREAA